MEVAVASTHEELVTIVVLGTEAPADFLELFAEATRRITEALEDPSDGRGLSVVSDLLRISRGRCGDEELISLEVEGDHVLLVDGVEESRPQTEIRGDEGGSRPSVKGDFRADIADVEALCPQALSPTDRDVLLVVARDVGGEGRPRAVTLLTASLIRMDVAQGYSKGEVGRELTGVARIDGELIGVRYAKTSS